MLGRQRREQEVSKFTQRTMSAGNPPNLRLKVWHGGLRWPKSQVVEKSMKFATKTAYRRETANVQRTGNQNGGSGNCTNTRTKICVDVDEELYKMLHTYTTRHNQTV